MPDNERMNPANDEIDLVDFSANREMDRIRENERIEREKRRRRAAEIRRRELIRQKKRKRIQKMIIAWGVVVLALLCIIAAIIGVISLFTGNDEEPLSDVGDQISKEESALVAAFDASLDIVYAKDYGEDYSDLLKDTVLLRATDENLVASVGEYEMYAKTYFWNSGFGIKDSIKQAVKNTPILNNGYVWSTDTQMRSTPANSYYYDTHASFIKAVCEICLWEGDASFLGEVDDNSAGEKDVSQGMSVRQKLENAVNYLFDTSDPYGGGIRYYEDEGLCRITTVGNDGTPQSKASNIMFTYKFGNLDCYNNLMFYDAMLSLSKLYAMMDDAEKSEYYASVAQNNKQAINETFYDEALGRYIGYIDVDGEKYDSGFTAINLMAVSLGVADETKTDSIMSWINGERKISSDNLDSTKILSGVLPVFSTVSADDSTWDTIGGKYLTSADAGFEKFWLNGGKSALSGYYNLLANKMIGEKDERAYINTISDAYASENYKLPDETNILSEPSLYYALLSSTAVKDAFGVSTDGNLLTVSPLFGLSKDVGIKNISFKRRNYDVLFDNDVVYVLCDTQANVKLRIGGFDSDQKVNVIVVEDAQVVTSDEVKADKNGNITISKNFGDTSYIKLEIVEIDDE